MSTVLNFYQEKKGSQATWRQKDIFIFNLKF